MEGVRVTGIDPQCSVKVLWQYFEDGAGRKGVVKEVYYPLLNNEAVVIFKDPSETAQVLTRRHEKWKVLPLPHQVFTRQRVWVEVDLSMLVQATEAYGDALRNLGQVEVSAEKNTKQLILTGQSYQIEWAWNYLSSLRDNQYHIAHILQTGSENSAVSRLSNGDLLTDDDRTLSRHERSHLSHHASKSPSLNGEARLQGEDRALAPAAADVASLAPGGMVSRGSHALLTEASGVSPRTQERVSVHAVHANSVTGSEKEWNNEENVASHTRAMATLDQGSLRSLNARERRRRQDDANNTFNEFASLPASTAHGDIAPQTSSAQHTDPHLSTGSRTRGPSKVLPSTAELDLAEAAHRSEREFQSLGFQHSPDHRAVGHYQSLQPMRGDANMDMRDMRDEETRGAYGGHRGQSFLHYSPGASAKMSDHYHFALLSNTNIEMSRKSFTIGKRLKLKIYVDDITKTKTEAVVNAANWELKNIGGVAGALARAAGPEMADECDRLFKRNGRLATAQVVKTKAYGKLNHLKYVIHTVGPIYTQTGKDRSVFELAQTFYNCLLFAEKLNLQSVTFPFISTGIFGMPTDDCILALVTALLVFSDERHSNLSFLEEVHFINNDINVVCEAIILAEQRIKIETVETTKQRMEDGRQRYGHYVYPYCAGHSHTASTGCRGDERHGTWDSSQGRDAADSWDPSQHKSDQLTPGPISRHRSGSLDLARKTVAAGSSDTKSSEKPKGRAPSPLPAARARSNSLTMAGRSSSSSSKNVDSQVHAQTMTTGKYQPVIKQPLATVKAGTKKKYGSSLKTHGSKGKTSDYSGNDTDTASAASSEVEDSDTKCPICLDTIQQPKKLPCDHRFCTSCIDRAMATNCRCPKCQRYFGISTGTQPEGGTMTYTINHHSYLEGYAGCGIIVISYFIPPGRQEACHPNPGRHYTGIQRTAYLPDNREGNEVLKMLQKAFKQRLVFTIGDSATTGACDVIVWNDIHHKTSTTGGPLNYGYPDPGYLIRVKEELAAKGITSP